MEGESKDQGTGDLKRTRDYHGEEWSSGQRGGGKVPEDFSWRSNPKQWQEEQGRSDPSRRLDG